MKDKGTWLGITEQGKMAFVTNCSQCNNNRKGLKSRGTLVTDYLRYNKTDIDPKNYAGFNFVYGNYKKPLTIVGTLETKKTLKYGEIHSISNGTLNSNLEKTSIMKGKVANLNQNITIKDLLDILYSNRTSDRQSSVFVEPFSLNSRLFGTVSSTVIIIDKQHKMTIVERNYKAAFENDPKCFENMEFGSSYDTVLEINL